MEEEEEEEEGAAKVAARCLRPDATDARLKGDAFEWFDRKEEFELLLLLLVTDLTPL